MCGRGDETGRVGQMYRKKTAILELGVFKWDFQGSHLELEATDLDFAFLVYG